MNYVGKNITLLIIIGVLLFVLFNLFQNQGGRGQATEVAYSELLSDASSGTVNDVTIKGDQIAGHMKDGKPFMTYAPRTADVATITRAANLLRRFVIGACPSNGRAAGWVR